MTVRAGLTHVTRYRYAAPVMLGPQELRLRPMPAALTPVSGYSLRVTPSPTSLTWHHDAFGNAVARVLLPAPTSEFSVTVDLVAELSPRDPFAFLVEPEAATYPFEYAPLLAYDLAPFRMTPKPSGALDAFAARVREAATGRATVDVLVDLAREVAKTVAYRQRMEPGVQAPAETLAQASGSCRDSAWLLIDLLRRLGFAARFVSGYLIDLPADRSRTTVDHAELHAWAECFLPGAGWIGFDATSGLVTAEAHIPLSATPTPEGSAPLSGTHSPADVDVTFDLRITRLSETPSPDQPFTDEQWRAVLDAGENVDRRLAAGDVRLSMGGEPTYVAANDQLAPEWNTAALGPTKRRYADQLARKLKLRFAPGGLIHHGLGKWYPGESTARWAFSVLWRTDGKPLWRDHSLIAEETPAEVGSPAHAEGFAGALAQQLGLKPDSAIPAYEDAAHALLAERRLPLGVDLKALSLWGNEERARLARTFDRGLGAPVGYVLPLLVDDRAGGRAFITERWKLRREALFLLPGDAPLGLRLPLASLEEIDFLDYPDVTPRDPFADVRPLPDTFEASPEAPQKGPVRTALTIEPKHGHVAVFLPPLADGEAYAALVASIEAAARGSSTKVRLEGYLPPFDPRLRVIKVTPDPGVIEVNVHPAGTFDETVAITTGVDEDARAVGLVADKFRFDGRRVGTGGGNHIVVGGAVPADSPFLRRPDLLASVVAYWQAHPALSFFFAGQFIGPTSQHPRIDEGRHEQLAELEIAFAQLPERGTAVRPWLVDRLFRNLLIDVTGNTHRAEICIDKLYALSGPMGRLGLVEFRAFEMAPHPRMTVACQLLVRALIAMLWERPYRHRLARFGATLHDRFVLPQMLFDDLADVCAELQSADLPIDVAWFKPQLEFRFPVIGTFRAAGVDVTLRQAHEPWLVLGEQDGGGTARTVDASLERLEIVARGDVSSRYAVACNGWLLPLAPTAHAGERIAAVRYRTRPAPSGFHPLIPPHLPLTFDIVDTWNDRSVGGARLHGSDPSGRFNGALPVNAREAEARRAARFETPAHSPTGTAFKTPLVAPEHPMTLDLRRCRG